MFLADPCLNSSLVLHSRWQRLGRGGGLCLAGVGHPFSPDHIEFYCLSGQVLGIAAAGGGRGVMSVWRPPPAAFVTVKQFGRGQGLNCGWEIDQSCLWGCQTGLALHKRAVHEPWVPEGVRELDLHQHSQLPHKDPKRYRSGGQLVGLPFAPDVILNSIARSRINLNLGRHVRCGALCTSAIPSVDFSLFLLELELGGLYKATQSVWSLRRNPATIREDGDRMRFCEIMCQVLWSLTDTL